MDALRALGSTPDGLSPAEAARRLAADGPNRIGGRRATDDVAILVRQFSSPIVLILVVATILSGVLGDATDATIIITIIALSGLLGFWQERGATRAVTALLAMVQVTAQVRRGGSIVPVPIEGVVRGDVVVLHAGNLVPGDARILDSTNLLADEAVLTGETYPVEKSAAAAPSTGPLTQRTNALFLGTHVVSGTGTAIVAATGGATQLGQVSQRLAEKPIVTGFERGLTAFGELLVRAMVVLVVAIFIINVLLARPLIDSALFSLALAVGLTPQLLPAIVTISLSEGARRMSERRVIVKRLDTIEDFGAMTILATDKTGTMTVGTVALDGALDVDGQPSPTVAALARRNAELQVGFQNPIDAAIVSDVPADSAVTAIAELPYDFTRRRLSVLYPDGSTPRLVTKGAFDSVLDACTTALLPNGQTVPLAEVEAAVRARFADLGAQGYRVLGLATRLMPGATALSPGDESDLSLAGFVTFVDPPKPGAAETIAALRAAGIDVRMITGDNRLAAAHVGRAVGLDPDHVLAGDQIAALDDTALAATAATTSIFAEVEPVSKERIIRALRASGAIVGYMGDGINDAPALHAADVAISVDTGVDVAKEAASIVLLGKDLAVLLDGVRQGRRTFANTMKYVYTTTSANFGNMLSMAVAAAVLPFLPLLAGQILLINFLTDFPATTIATDAVDPEQLERPHAWDIGFVRTFMVVFGGISSVFDLLTFAILILGFGAGATLFRSGWFVESIATELAVLLVLRTRGPFFRSRPSGLLAGSTLAIAALSFAIPFSPLAGILGLEPPSPAIVVALLLVTLGYVATTELAKASFYARVRGG